MKGNSEKKGIRPWIKWIGLLLGLLVGTIYYFLSQRDLNFFITVLRLGAIGFLLGVVVD